MFKQPVVLEAWRSLDAFKITALGHTQNSTLLDRFSHKVADTSTAAGKFILESVDAEASRAYWRDQAEKAATVQAQAAHGLQVQVVALQNQRAAQEAERATLREDLQRARDALPAAAVPKWVWIALPAAAILGAVAWWALLQ